MGGDGADLVVVGAGTVGGWAAFFAASGGARVTVIDRGTAGQGASIRAAGIVRAQGGTPVAVALGRWSIDFYRGQQEALGTDSGFRELGYLLLATTDDQVAAGRARVAMQRDLGLDVAWLSPAEAVGVNPSLSEGSFLGASYLATDGCIDPPRNVRAYSLAMRQAGVDLRERTPFLGLRTEPGGGVAAVETPGGVIETRRVLLTGGPGLRSVGALAGIAVPAGGVRHQVAVTEPHRSFEVERMPMAFDVADGLYWRLEEGGLLFGMSNPDEPPGEAREVDWPYLERMRERLATFVRDSAGLGLRKVWAATIDYTPDHLPILGPGLTQDGALEGVTVASAGGHGMMWGPAVARAAADLAVSGATDVVDVSDLGLDRFDSEGRSRVAADPVALPFPETISGDAPSA